MAVTDALRRIAGALPGIQLLVVFGSTARGRDRVGSDLDVGVILGAGPVALRRTVEVALARAADRDVDVVDLDTASPLLRFEVARDGILIHEGRPHAWADFRARAMLDWWEWSPTVRMIQDAAIQRLRAQVVRGPR